MEKTLFCELNNKVSSLFESEAAVVHVDYSSVIIVGDLHGNLEALDFILEKGEELDCSNYIFLGDYVDRGDHSIEVLCRLFKLKLEDPDGVILLRGNHETAGTNANYGLYDELDKNDELFSLVNRTFEKMPIAAVLNIKSLLRTSHVFCVHGGIGEPVTLDQIKKEDHHPYLWNDPQEEKGLEDSPQRCGTQVFGPDICKKFRTLNDIDIIIRAHSELKDGYKWWFDGRLLSLFSTPDYSGLDDDGAFVFIEHDEWKMLQDKLNTFVFGRSQRSKDDSYSLLNITSHNSERFEFYDSETASTITILFRFFKENNILVISYNHGEESPLWEGVVIADEYTFTEPNAIDKVILECRSIETLDDLYPLLAKHSLEWKRLLDFDENDL
ncbi:metallophosphoesterase [Methanolobus sp. ZRKC5]|uniref:metallophosphoesterase n=1 Tax=unclassified Methanolobus TaxID=2629569 RepID=UPI00313DB7E4